MSEIALRMRRLIETQVTEHRRFKALEELSGISREAWRAFWNDRQKPSSEMVAALAEHWPQFAFWLATGVTDPDYGHVAPVSSPGYTVLKGKEQQATTEERRQSNPQRGRDALFSWHLTNPARYRRTTVQTAFAWYAIHKDTKHIIAGFNEYSDALAFCSAFAHCQYVVRDRATVEAIHDPL